MLGELKIFRAAETFQHIGRQAFDHQRRRTRRQAGEMHADDAGVAPFTETCPAGACFLMVLQDAAPDHPAERFSDGLTREVRRTV